MGQTAEDLRTQLAEQRGDISRDLEAIGDRVSPGRMMERRQAADHCLRLPRGEAADFRRSRSRCNRGIDRVDVE